MKVIHLIGGGDIGGAKAHVLSLVKALGSHIDVKLISLRPGPFADDARAMGIDVEVVKSFNIFADIRRVAKIIKEGQYEIIHSHGAKANMFSFAVRCFIRLPSVTTVHSDYKLDYMQSRLKTLTLGTINAVALRTMDYYITISGNFRKMLVERKFKPSDMFILYNGLDFSLPYTNSTRANFIEKYKLPVDEEDVIIGILARFHPVKSIDTFIKAAKIVNDKNKNVKFVIGGDGEEHANLVNLTKSLGLENCVFFAGWVNNEEFLNGIDISVLTSISESFPYSILEGVKYKKPTISSRVGGIPDLIEDGFNGYLFEPRDHAKLAELILDLASDGEKRRLMGQRIYDKALASFSLESMCRTQLNIYNGILKREEIVKKSGKAYDVIISGYYGFQNIGDDAMLMSIINDLSKFNSETRMLILSCDPQATALQYNTDSVKRTSLLGIFRALRNSKVFLYGGGNLIQDDTSTRSLLFYLMTIWIAEKMGLKVMIYANGIGPLKRSLNRYLTGRILNHVDVITLREEHSYKEIINLGITRPVIKTTADPALAVADYKLEDCNKLLSSLGIPSGRSYFGVSARVYPGHGAYEPEKYEAAIAGLADHMYERFGLLPVFIPMQYPVDYPILKRIAAKMKNKCYVVEKLLNVQETVSLISCMDILAGMRLHALIFAAATGVPVVGLSYQPKIDAFLKYSGQASAGNVLSLDYNKLVRTAEDVWERRLEIRKQLETGILHFRDKALENARIATELIDRADK